jgi:tetratricopeptide (TPR) repeat protein
MKKLKRILSILVLIYAAGQFYAQNHQIDSILSLVKLDKEDTNKVNHLHSLCKLYQKENDYPAALVTEKKALELALKINWKKGQAKVYNSIAVIYDRQGNYSEALKNHFISLKIKEEIGDKKGIAYSYNNIGNIYQQLENYSDAMKNYDFALKLLLELNDKKGLAAVYAGLGNVNVILKKFDVALKNEQAALKLYEELNDSYGIANMYNNLGVLDHNQDNYEGALTNYLLSLHKYEILEDKDGLARGYLNSAGVYIKLNNLKDADAHLAKSLKLSLEIGAKESIKDSYLLLTALDSVRGNYKAAFEHHKLFVAYKDSLNNEEIQKKSVQSSMQYEFDKKELAAKAEQDKLDAIALKDKQKKEVIIYAVLGVLVIVILFAVFLFNRFRITKKQKKIIEEQKLLVDVAYKSLHEKNKEVMDSIHYAKRIQTALITSET